MREGWDYVRTFRPIRTILLLFAIISLTGWPYSVLLPIFAGQVLHGGANTLGWLTGASGVGALVSVLSLALCKSVVGLMRMIQISAAMLGGGLILFGLSHTLWLSLIVMLFVGFGMMQGLSASNTVIQTLVSEDKCARVMSYYTMVFRWHGPIRQPDGRRACAANRCAPHGYGLPARAVSLARYGSRSNCRKSER